MKRNPLRSWEGIPTDLQLLLLLLLLFVQLNASKPIYYCLMRWKPYTDEKRVSRCQVDLSTLSKEQTHKLELPLEEGEGCLVLLVTLTASAAVTISDLSVNSLEDPKEREEILKRYVWSSLLIFVCEMFAYINTNY